MEGFARQNGFFGLSGLGPRSGGGAITSLVHVPEYGQSNILGSTGGATAEVISDPSPAGHYMFNAGVRAHYDTPGLSNINTYVDPASLASLVPLAEQVGPNAVSSGMGETISSGMAAQMTSKGIFCAMGRGAYPISSLIPYTPTENTAWFHWSNLYASVLQSRRLATAAGFDWTLGDMIWDQGEADGAANTSKADYKTRKGYAHDWCVNSLGEAAQQDMSGFKIICHQQALGQTGTTFSDIAVANIELHREQPGKFVCAGPTYNLEYAGANDVHRISNTHRNWGEKLGLVWQAGFDGAGFNPCHALSATGVRSGNNLDISIWTPVPPLVIDTTLVSAIANSGFVVPGNTINSVNIVDDGAADNVAVIRLVLDSATGGTWQYAYGNNAINQRIGPVHGPRGNIRDSDPFTTINDATPMPNWLCVDQGTFS